MVSGSADVGIDEAAAETHTVAVQCQMCTQIPPAPESARVLASDAFCGKFCTELCVFLFDRLSSGFRGKFLTVASFPFTCFARAVAQYFRDGSSTKTKMMPVAERKH